MAVVPANLRAWAEIDATALAHNLAHIRRRVGGARVMAVVKADAYGHGVGRIAPLCAQAGVADFGVATVAEGVALRPLVRDEASIYLLSPTVPAEVPEVVSCRLTPLLTDRAVAQALSEEAQRQEAATEAHLDVDTGMGRSGVGVGDAPALLSYLDGLPGLRVTGLATHFARADEDEADARAQHAQFVRLLDELGPRARSLLIHASNSPATLRLPPAHHHLVRPGLLLYGIAPSPGMRDGADFRPVLSLRARVILCRPLPGGATVSYGKTYTVPAGGGVYATVGAGYGDGYPRRLSSAGYVLLHGRRAPICGRVCMDQFVVDVTNVPGVGAGDVATLIGKDGDEAITAGDLAESIGTTPHEITTCLTARVPRLLA